jgi:hypothetical protein
LAKTDDDKNNDRDDGEPDLVLDVMLGEPGGATFNTVVLGGTDVVVPLERDLDGDPYQDDEVWLESLDGSFRMKRLSSDPDVIPDEDNNVLLYHFRHVPFGVYNVVAVVAARPIVVTSGLVVRKQGVFLGDEKLADTYAGGAFGETDDAAEDPSAPDATAVPDEGTVDTDKTDGDGSLVDAYDDTFDEGEDT